MKTYELTIECVLEGHKPFLRTEYFALLEPLPLSVAVGKAIMRTIDLYIQLGLVHLVSFRYVAHSYGFRDDTGWHQCLELR